ncbi:MAG: (deoxy)nucleoside triphosphate pyrophosphohydrolase [Suipraeoptans sp.]
MKSIQVVAAIIKKDNKVLATQRGYGDFKDGWEFPGGKVEPNEILEDALVREIREELRIEVEVGELIHTVEYDYPKFHLTMHCFLCSVISGNLTLVEHEASKWLGKKEMKSVDWLPADIELVEIIEEKCFD